jgi:hypothetical protein
MVMYRTLVAVLLVAMAFPASAEPVQRHLVICVDGVAFSTIERMREEGKFAAFRAPSRMVAPFPSITNLAMTEILRPAGAADSPGYEDTYYDADANRMRGGLLDRFRGDRFVEGTFRERFDYHPSAVKSGLGYALPPLSTYLEASSDLARLRQKFRDSRDPVFLGYMGGTDSLAHLGGERMLRWVLSRLDETVEELIREGEGRTEVTIFSDHGNDFRKYRRVSLERALERAGLEVEKSIEDERSVVVPEYGLIGAVVLFTAEVNEERAAVAAARARGVAFAAHERDGVVYLVSRRGRAAIDRRGDRYRYRPGGGDPLGLAPVIEELAARGAVDDDGFVAESDWWAATVDGPRPDAVRRVYEGLTEHVRSRASVVVDLEDGYLAGSLALDLFAVMRATHGNVGREQTLGFVMTTARDLPPYLRAHDVWPAIDLGARAYPPGASRPGRPARAPRATP